MRVRVRVRVRVRARARVRVSVLAWRPRVRPPAFAVLGGDCGCLRAAPAAHRRAAAPLAIAPPAAAVGVQVDVVARRVHVLGRVVVVVARMPLLRLQQRGEVRAALARGELA